MIRTHTTKSSLPDDIFGEGICNLRAVSSPDPPASFVASKVCMARLMIPTTYWLMGLVWIGLFLAILS
jgi:hypothetical protein